ncbi:hypothetical protein Bhyg_12991 [Pseudolycoriella hygida]|uniref:Uncharacterized protein n=1 Tax=Pseudolycoriella hygida TaxID=35572 RepID=A0A9Q0MYB6_9DIPT|nr:hypothetical protein Bhyg_12991 [Pseudolycoriella hygida]
MMILNIIATKAFCVRDCNETEFKEVCARRPDSDKEVVVQNKCILDRQICYDTEFGSKTYTFLHDEPCKGWDGWTYEKVGEKPSFAQ